MIHTLTGITIRRSQPADLADVLALLEHASLPREGVREHFETFHCAHFDGKVVGAIGLELYGDTALLRSAVVATDLRHTGIGSLLFQALCDFARTSQVRRLLLLTNTAEAYFRMKGFRTIDAKSVTGPITQSVEFSGACPDHAACMEMAL